MSMTTKQAMREARRVFRLCLVNGTLDEGRARELLRTVIQLRRRGYLSVLGFFLRLVKLFAEELTLARLDGCAHPLANAHVAEVHS